MRIVVAGSRDRPEDPALIAAAVAASPFAGKITTVIEGGARGIDRAARLWAERSGIPVVTVAADWRRYGRGAGPRRNAAMAAQADGVIVIRYSATMGSGSRSMVHAANAASIPVFAWLAGAASRARDDVRNGTSSLVS